jgi:formate-nitrite transporter family protein
LSFAAAMRLLGRLPHVVAGSADAAFAVFSGHATVFEYLLEFLLPTLVGNTIGGVALVAFLNHAPLAPELQENKPESRDT